MSTSAPIASSNEHSSSAAFHAVPCSALPAAAATATSLVSSAAADAPRAVLQAHLQRSERAVAPRAEQEAERAAAPAETDVLQRRQLVDGGDEEGRAGDPAAGTIPGEHVACGALSGQRDRERQRSGAGPGEEIAARKEEGRERRSCLGHARVEGDRRRDGGEHHCGHHHDPDAREPAERAESGPGAVVHAAHLIECPPPAERGEREEQGDERESRANCCQGWSESRGSGGDQALRRPRRTRRSRARSCPRIGCRTR